MPNSYPDPDEPELQWLVDLFDGILAAGCELVYLLGSTVALIFRR